MTSSPFFAALSFLGFKINVFVVLVIWDALRLHSGYRFGPLLGAQASDKVMLSVLSVFRQSLLVGLDCVCVCVCAF